MPFGTRWDTNPKQIPSPGTSQRNPSQSQASQRNQSRSQSQARDWRPGTAVPWDPGPIAHPWSKSKNVARRLFSPFPLLLDAKNRLSISEMVSAQSLQKVWVVLKKKLPQRGFEDAPCKQYLTDFVVSRLFETSVKQIE